MLIIRIDISKDTTERSDIPRCKCNVFKLKDLDIARDKCNMFIYHLIAEAVALWSQVMPLIM